MSARLIGTLFALCGLVVLAVGLCLPPDRGLAAPVGPAKPGSDLAVLPGDCALFLTIRPAEVVNDPLAKAFAQGSGLLRGLDVDAGVGAGLDNIERMTAANMGGEMVTIVRTSKPYDKAKLLKGLPNPRGYYGFKDKKDFKDAREPEEEKPQLIEKKVGGKSIHFYSNPAGGRERFGDPYRYTQAIGIVDRNVFVRGRLSAVEALLGSKVKQTPELAHQLELSAKHTIVAGFQGKQIRAALRAEARRWEEDRKRWSKKGFPGEEEPEKKEKPKKEDKDDDSVVLSSPEMLLFKPFIVMKSAVITGDIGKVYKVSARISYPNAETADDGEPAAKMLLYLVREGVAMATKPESGLRPLAPLVEPLQKAIKGAKLERTGNTLETSISLTIEDGVIKKVREEVEAEKKREEERMKKYREDRERFFKDKRKD